MGGDDVSPEILRDRRLNTDPTKNFIAGKDRVPLKRTLGVGWQYVETVDRALDERGNPGLYDQKREEMKQVSLEAGKLGLKDIAVGAARGALSKIPEGFEGRGEEISKALVRAAFDTEVDTQELLDNLVADGKLPGEQADRVSGWVGVELLRLAAHAKESSRLGGPRQEIMDALYPVSGQINTENWNSGTWAAHVVAAREPVSMPAGESTGQEKQEAAAGTKKEGFAERAARAAEGFFKDPKSLGWIVFLADETIESLPPLIKAYAEKYKANIAADTASQIEAEARRKARAAGYLNGTISPPPPTEKAVAAPAEKVPTATAAAPSRPEKPLENTQPVEGQKKKKRTTEELSMKMLGRITIATETIAEAMKNMSERDREESAGKAWADNYYQLLREEVDDSGHCTTCGAGRGGGEPCGSCGAGTRAGAYIEAMEIFKDMFGGRGREEGEETRVGGGGVGRGARQTGEEPDSAGSARRARPGEGIRRPEAQEQLGATADFFDERDFEAWGLSTRTVIQRRGHPIEEVSAVDLLNQYALSPRGLADRSEQMGLMAVLSEKDRTSPNFTNGLINLIELRRAHNGYMENYDGLTGHQRITDGLSVKNMAELISTNEQSMKAMTLVLQLARAPVTRKRNGEVNNPFPERSLAAEIFNKYQDVWVADDKRKQPEVNQKVAEMKAEIAQKLDISRGAADIAVTYAQAWGGRMGFTEMAEMAKKFPPFAEAGYTGSFMDKVEVMLDVRGAGGRIEKKPFTLGRAWDGWTAAGMTQEEATAAVMRVLRDGGAPVNALTQSWNYLGSAKEVLDEMERVYSGKQHLTWTAKERDAVVYGDGKSVGLIGKWNGKWKYSGQVLGKSIEYCRKTQISGASTPVTEAARPGLGGFVQSTKEYKEHPPGLADVFNSWARIFTRKK